MSNYVNPECELAAYWYLLANLPDWLKKDPAIGDSMDGQRVYRGVDNPESEGWFNRPRNLRKVPCVVLRCELASPVVPNYHGMWLANVEVDIISNRYSDTDQAHTDHCRDIFDRFCTTTIAEDLAAVYKSNTKDQTFFVKKVIPGDVNIRAEGKTWVTSLQLRFEETGHLNADQKMTTQTA